MASARASLRSNDVQRLAASTGTQTLFFGLVGTPILPADLARLREGAEADLVVLASDPELSRGPFVGNSIPASEAIEEFAP